MADCVEHRITVKSPEMAEGRARLRGLLRREREKAEEDNVLRRSKQRRTSKI